MSACNESRREDGSLSCSDLVGCEEHTSLRCCSLPPAPPDTDISRYARAHACTPAFSPRRAERRHAITSLADSRARFSPLCICTHAPFTLFTSDKSSFLKVLTDAEVAANGAAIQVVSFKDAIEDEFDVCCFVLFLAITYLGLLEAKATCLNETICFSLVIKDSKPAAADKRRLARQRGLLLEKLEDFKRLNKAVRQKLKQLQDSEVGFSSVLVLFKQQ